MEAIRVIAHRGQSLTVPEQTLAAFVGAARLGADMIEADVASTDDGVLVMMHDATVDRTTSGTGAIADLAWSDVRELDAGSWFGPSFADERVPSLEQLFDLADRLEVGLCLEAKGATDETTLDIAVRVAERIRDRGRLESDVLASFDHAALAAAGRHVPGLRVAPDRLPERGPSTAADLIAQADACGARIIQHHCDDLDADVAATVQAAGVEVWAWPATDLAQVQRAIAAGVAGVMGDDVTAIISALNR